MNGYLQYNQMRNAQHMC